LTRGHERCTIRADVKRKRILLSDKKGRARDSFFIGMQESDTLFTKLEPLLSEVGLFLVDLIVSRHHGSAQVRMTVYSPKGTGTNECAKAHRIAYPEIVSILAHPDPSLEVASPGIDRVLRTAREWAIFKGKGVRVLLHGEEEWIRGRIASVDGESVSLDSAGGFRVIGLESVSKAKLDSSQEGD
jgi:ribosome maturation factor RimP